MEKEKHEAGIRLNQYYSELHKLRDRINAIVVSNVEVSGPDNDIRNKIDDLLKVIIQHFDSL